MQNSIQMNVQLFSMEVFWEIRGASQSEGFLLLSPSQCPWAPALPCWADVHHKVCRLNLRWIAFAVFAKLEVSQFWYFAICVTLGKSLNSELSFFTCEGGTNKACSVYLLEGQWM